MNLHTTIYLVRHGQSVWNTKQLVQGQNQTRENTLTKKGIAQAESISQTLKDIHFDAIFSSDLLRAHKTTEIIALERKIVVSTTQALREKSHAEFEGMATAEYRKLFTKWVSLSTEQRMNYKLSDSAESPNEAIARFILFLRETAIAYSGKSILIVTHGGMMRDFLIKLGKETYDSLQGFENTGYITLRSDGVDFFVDEVIGAKHTKRDLLEFAKLKVPSIS